MSKVRTVELVHLVCLTRPQVRKLLSCPVRAVYPLGAVTQPD